MLGGIVLACLAGRADAADARLQFAIPPRSYADALIDLGLQANVSVLGTSNCGAGGRAELSGRYTLDQALTRLLAGAPCAYQIIDERTVKVVIKLPAGPAHAREPARPAALVAELVVTATKRPAALDRVPAGVSAISGDQMATTDAVDIGRTVGQLAGVLTTNLGPGRDKLLIRGLSDGAFTGRARSTVATYLDHAPINYNAPDPDLRLADVDRIEVVRGPQGPLYGSGAMAGIYRIVTRKPDLEQMRVGLSATAAATQGGDRSHEIEGYANLPLLRDHIGVRLTAYDDVQGGYLDDFNLRIANVDQTKRNGGRLAVRVRLNPNWRLDALAATQNLRSNDTQYVTTALSPRSLAAPKEDSADSGGANAPGERANRVREAHNNDFDYGGATLQGDFEWGSVSSSISYVHHVFSSQYDASAALSIFAGQATDLGVYVEAARSDMLVEDLVVRSSGRGPFDWLVGVYAARTTERSPSSLGILSAGPVLATAYSEYRKDRLGDYALYGEASYELSDGWSATIGGRVFSSHIHTTADLNIIEPFGPRGFDRSRAFRGFAPKVSIQKNFAGGNFVYALFAEGYRPGGFNSSGFFPIRDSRTTFRPDRLRNYEAGVKLRSAGGQLAVRAAAYYDEWTNIQTDQYRPSGLAFTGNVGDAQIAGLEGELSYNWPFGLSLQLNGLISDSRISHANTDFAPQVTGALPGVPKVSGGLLAVYERPVAERFTLRLLGEASFVGGSALSFDASLPPRMGRYLRARLSAELAGDGWRVTAFVSNPFNDAGDTFAYGNPFSFGQVRQVTPQRPRTFGLRLAATI